MVASVHRLLAGRRPGQPGSEPVWVLYGAGTGDVFYHDLWRGSVSLRRTFELWALDEWATEDDRGSTITVTLTTVGELDFRGNPDPDQAQAVFDQMRSHRPQRYGRRRQRSAENTATTSADQAAADHAASTLEDSMGVGQRLVNNMRRLQEALASDSPNRLLVVVENYAQSIYMMLARREDPQVADARDILENGLLRVVSQRRGMIVFLATVHERIAELVPLDPPCGIRWVEVPPVGAGEVEAALRRVSRRRDLAIADPAAVGACLSSLHRTMRAALGVTVRVRASGRAITMESVLDLPPVDEARVGQILAELDAMVGLELVKEKVRRIVDHARRRRDTLRETGQWPDETLHLVFEGGAGTGKTTVARLVAGLYHALGLLPRNEVQEITASQGIMASEVGQTRVNMQAALDRALGGVVFIDEAHSFGDAGSFQAQEAIQALVPMAWNHRDDLVVILAGYGDQMHTVLRMDQGMPRRFPESGRLRFEDYTEAELWQILLGQLHREGWDLDQEAERPLRMLLKRRSQGSGFGNAGGVDNLVKEIVEHHDSRPGAVPGRLGVDDLPPAVVRHENVLAEAQAALDDLVGLGRVRRLLQDLRVSIEYDLQESPGPVEVGHLLLLGPPGTGKTTVARLLTNLLYGIGALTRNTCVETSGPALKQPYMGQTANHLAQEVERARGGVFFIDEAYGIVTGSMDSYGHEALAELMRQMTLPDNRGTVFMLAGYEAEMQQLLSVNPGLQRRTQRIIFDPFTPSDCAELARRRLRRNEFTAETGFFEAFERAAAVEQRRQGASFGNAGWAERALSDATTRMKARVVASDFPAGDHRRKQLLVVDLEESLGLPLAPGAAEPGSVAPPAEFGDDEPAPAPVLDGSGSWAPQPQHRFLPLGWPEGMPRSTVIDRLLDSTVHVLVETPEGPGGAAGFVATGDGLVVTNAHVVEGASRIEVLMGPQRGSSLARVLLSDTAADLAVLAVTVPPENPSPPLPLGVSDGLRPLDELHVVGMAMVQAGEPARVVSVQVARNDALNGSNFETDGAVEPGFSGGPVFDPEQGAVAGVVQGGRGQTVRVMIRVEQVRRLLESLGYEDEAE